jgi:hypothetical protein
MLRHCQDEIALEGLQAFKESVELVGHGQAVAAGTKAYNLGIWTDARAATILAAMRYALAAVVLLAAVPASAAPRVPTPDQLITAFGEANDSCRGSRIEAECGRRERIASRLNQIGWCYGRKGQVAAQFDWHHCTANSYYTTDLGAN